MFDKVVTTAIFSTSVISLVGQNCNCVMLTCYSVPKSKVSFGPMLLLDLQCESVKIRNSQIFK